MKTKHEKSGLLVLCALIAMAIFAAQSPALAQQDAPPPEQPEEMQGPGQGMPGMRGGPGDTQDQQGSPRSGRRGGMPGMPAVRPMMQERAIRSSRVGMPGMQEKLEEAKKVLQKYYPEMAEQLNNAFRRRRRVGDTDPQAGARRARQLLNKLWPMMIELVEADRKNPDYARLLVDDHRLQQKIDKKARQYQNAEKDDREELSDEIHELLAQQFEVRQKIRTWRLEELERQIKKLRKELEAREKNQEKLINRELKRRLGKNDDLNW